MTIGAIDLAVIALYTASVIAIGMWVGRGQKDLSGYLLGGKNLPWWAILGSIVATETSTATFLSVPGVAFAKSNGNMRFLQLTFGYILGRTIIVYFLLPLYFRGELYTAYQVLHERFGGTTKRISSLIFLVTRNLGDGLRLFLTAIAMQHAVGLPIWICVVAIGIATICYTVFGGMKSVIWNDCIQMVIYVVGGLLALAIILGKLPDGWQTFQEYGVAQGKFQLFDFRMILSDPLTFWAGLLGGMFLTLGTHGTDQMMVQRYLCARSQADAGRALIASGFLVFLQFALFLLLGVALACFYDLNAPDREFAGDRVFATFIVEEMPVGIVGVLLAAVFAAAMSTLSSSLNSSAGAVVNDFQGIQESDPDSSKRLVGASRLWTVFFGILQIVIGIAAERFSDSVVGNALAIASFAAGLLLGVFALGVLTERVGQGACLVGLLAGLITLVTVKFGLPFLGGVLFNIGLATGQTELVIAWPWYAMIGSTTTFAVGLLASFVLPRTILTKDEQR